MIAPDLTADGEHYDYREINPHCRWIACTIHGARAQGIPWAIVGMHKNCISVGVFYYPVYQELTDLVVQKKVDLVLRGHAHTYQRRRQRLHRE